MASLLALRGCGLEAQSGCDRLWRLCPQVCDTHRLDDNKAERKRCEDAGYEVCRSTVDGKPVGPERVWPGGLAMSRTIGDHMVSPAALSTV